MLTAQALQEHYTAAWVTPGITVPEFLEMNLTTRKRNNELNDLNLTSNIFIADFFKHILGYNLNGKVRITQRAGRGKRCKGKKAAPDDLAPTIAPVEEPVEVRVEKPVEVRITSHDAAGIATHPYSIVASFKRPSDESLPAAKRSVTSLKNPFK